MDGGLLRAEVTKDLGLASLVKGRLKESREQLEDAVMSIESLPGFQSGDGCDEASMTHVLHVWLSTKLGLVQHASMTQDWDKVS